MKFKPRIFIQINFGRLLAIAGVVVLVVAVLLLKSRESGTVNPNYPMAARDAVTQPLPTEDHVQVSNTPNGPSSTAIVQLSPEAQLDQYLAEDRPILAFFHSNTCVKCIQMTEIVEQVYPDFADRIALVDVNVYEQRNQSLLGRAGIQVIPTLIFIDRDQQGQGYSGVMPAEGLQEQLEALAKEP